MKIKFFTFLFIFSILINPALAYFLQDSHVTTTGRVVVDKKIYDENREIKLHIHGDGVYSSKQKIYGDAEVMKYEEDTIVSKIGNLSWTDDLCLKNYQIYAAIRERYTHSEFIDKDTLAYMNENETYAEIVSSFQGMGYFALKSLKTVYADTYEYYIGNFNLNKIVYMKSKNESDMGCP